MQKVSSLEKILMLEKFEGRRRLDDRGWGGWMISPTQWTWVCTSSGKWSRTGKPRVLQSMGSQRVRQDWETEQQQSLKTGHDSRIVTAILQFLHYQYILRRFVSLSISSFLLCLELSLYRLSFLSLQWSCLYWGHNDLHFVKDHTQFLIFVLLKLSTVLTKFPPLLK